MFLASEQGGNLTMEILRGSSYTGAGGARPGTRGANRGEREEFKSAMRRQAARSHESVEDIDLFTGGPIQGLHSFHRPLGRL